jgi:predicted nucleotidyltransferase
MGYVDDAFLNLKGKLEVTATESDLAVRRHHEIRDHVRESWDLEADFLTGSYRRWTKTKPLRDVDIFVVIDRSGPQAPLRQSGPNAVLDELATVLKKKYGSVVIDRMACTVNFGSGEEITSFDVVPAFERATDEFEIPETRSGGWIATNPKRHHEMSTEKNGKCDGKYVPLVKMVKSINRELGEPVTPSFLIEVMALELVTEPFGTYQDEVRWFLASAAEGVAGSWPDPAGLGPDVNTMTSTDRITAATALAGAQAIAERAILLEDDSQERAAVEEWRRLFSWRMPRP